MRNWGGEFGEGKRAGLRIGRARVVGARCRSVLVPIAAGRRVRCRFRVVSCWRPLAAVCRRRPSVRLSVRPRFLLPLPSSPSFISCFLPNWRSWQNRDVAARERGSRCQICRNGTTKLLRERALRHKSARRACDAFNSSCAEQLRTGVSCDGDEDTEGLAPAVAEMNRRSIFSSCHFGGFVR